MVSQAAAGGLGGAAAGGGRMKVRMGAPKQKWTPEEESALRAGVDKYGPGKWRAIQRDPKFGPALIARSNVDLKDKWRNLSVNTGPRVPRSKARRGSRAERATLKNLSDDSDSEEEDLEMDDDEDDDEDDGSEPIYNQRKLLGTRYDDLVSEAITILNEPNGSDIPSIAHFIERRVRQEHQRVPSRFRKLLALKLKALTAQGKLVKVGKTFMVKDMFCGGSKAQAPKTATRIRLPQNLLAQNPAKFLRPGPNFDVGRSRSKTAEEAARLAAQAIAEAEAASMAADQAAREAEAAEAEAERAEAEMEMAALAARSGKIL